MKREGKNGQLGEETCKAFSLTTNIIFDWIQSSQ